MIHLFVLLSLLHLMTISAHQYKISVIMPVYNTQTYIRESIDSVIGQTIGFIDNIQLIIVNDGSTDNSKPLCLRYQQLYPNNIIYLEQTHRGVSSARNLGLDYVSGKYVTFLDSDDKWDLHAFSHLFSFFEKHHSRLDVVAARIKVFEAWNGYPELDFKYDSTGIVDLLKHPNYIQLSAVYTFIKAATATSRRFSTKLQYGEDGQFINSILLSRCSLGVVREAVYLVRKRRDKSSALDREILSRSYLFDSPIYYHEYLYNLSRTYYGTIARFIQHTIMYEIKWRLMRPVDSFLSPAETLFYQHLIANSLRSIDDSIILFQTDIPLCVKILCISKKYPDNWILMSDSGIVSTQQAQIINLHESSQLLVDSILEISSDKVMIVFKDECPLPPESYQVLLRIDDTMLNGSYLTEKSNIQKTMFGPIEVERYIKFEWIYKCGSLISLYINMNTRNGGVVCHLHLNELVKGYHQRRLHHLLITPDNFDIRLKCCNPTQNKGLIVISILAMMIPLSCFHRRKIRLGCINLLFRTVMSEF